MNDMLDKENLTAPGAGGEEAGAPVTPGTPGDTAPAAPVTPEAAVPEAAAGEAAPTPAPGGSQAPEAPGTPGPQEERTVFGPSPWKKKAAEPKPDHRAGAKARQEEAAAKREEEKAAREARALEAQIAKEHRRAQEEERRMEARRREDEERQRRREEKAQQKTVRRVGTMTLGVSLIAIGAAILMYMVNPSFNIQIVAYLAPVILISLGVEVLIRYFFSKDRTYKYDFASGLICIFLVLGSFCVAVIPEIMYYVSPQRFASEERLISQEQEKLYRAFSGDQRVRDFYVNGSINGYLGEKDESGNWIYALDYLQIHVNLLDGSAGEAEFAQVCRELLDKIAAQGMGKVGYTRVSFHSPYNDEGVQYSLELNNRLQMEMDVEHLQKLVDTTYSRPTRENGWYPEGYDEIRNNYGASYAEQFSHLLEDYGEEEAAGYYYILYNVGESAAETYYTGLVGETPQPDGAEDGPEGGDASEPPAPEPPESPSNAPDSEPDQPPASSQEPDASSGGSVAAA